MADLGTRQRGRGLETVLRTLAVVFALAGPLAYYYEDTAGRPLRLGLLLGAWILAGLCFAGSEAGKLFLRFLREARVELRKVVWPTRPQYLQTTGFVIVMVVVLALLMWVFDLGLGALMRALTVGG
jgi:preprotein translocase subunit SecE